MPQGTGEAYENVAKEYLEKQGLKFLHRNYRCRQGEIDLIMREKDTLVFVEVKYRKRATHGVAAESVSSQKQTRIAHTAKRFLQEHKLWNMNCRFDVVAIDGTINHTSAPTLHWMQAAFNLN